MSFEIINETYKTLENENPKKYGYIEGYTSNTIGKTYLRLNVKSIPDQEQYDHHKKLGIQQWEFRVGQPYGEGIRLNRKQVIKLIWELIKWLIKGY